MDIIGMYNKYIIQLNPSHIKITRKYHNKFVIHKMNNKTIQDFFS